ncbi:zinc-finger homeodomain protein 2 isoform X2 [Argentina anserina]|uniref:zinc-finger homeodomain protein 2 isoform X2 n=1 Tax=Argentina anserina TaxID=57926 RepID=UPI0021764014|nr:zinc-finger homeodomain protein 2 isoform X2 [Potentilla anserina]
MEFSDHHDDQDEEMELSPTAPTPPEATPRKRGGATNSTSTGSNIRYRECLKNHAVNIGGHALDGCGEFLAAGEEGTLDALQCAACNCHRNFHRKEPAEVGGGATLANHQQQHTQQPFSAYYRHPYPPQPSGYLHLTTAQPHRPIALPAAAGSGGSHSREEGDDVSNPSSSGGGGSGVGLLKKRFRTKFTAEQKEKMVEFSEKVGWRIQKHDEAAVEEFCAETGVKRQVLKVWMHNNKHTIGKKP